jgi:hypothetical protein
LPIRASIFRRGRLSAGLGVGKADNLALRGLCNRIVGALSDGIVTKVVRCALQDPASVAALLITTEAMVAELLCDACSGGMGGKRGVAGDHARARRVEQNSC